MEELFKIRTGMTVDELVGKSQSEFARGTSKQLTANCKQLVTGEIFQKLARSENRGAAEAAEDQRSLSPVMTTAALPS